MYFNSNTAKALKSFINSVNSFCTDINCHHSKLLISIIILKIRGLYAKHTWTIVLCSLMVTSNTSKTTGSWLTKIE